MIELGGEMCVCRSIKKYIEFHEKNMSYVVHKSRYFFTYNHDTWLHEVIVNINDWALAITF